MPTDLFTILQPQGKSLPIVANLPHSGLLVPQEIADSFTEHQRQTLPNSDWHLQQLYSFLPSLGITIMQANYSRYVVDLNRALKAVQLL
ncbi:MAG: N-formylglutamate amidohydrolase [Cyanobacteria bacterium J06627_28]